MDAGRSQNIFQSGECVPRMLRSTKRCAADPGSTTPLGPLWVPALRCIVKHAAPRPGHETHCLTLSQDEVRNPPGEERGNAARLEPCGRWILSIHHSIHAGRKVASSFETHRFAMLLRMRSC